MCSNAEQCKIQVQSRLSQSYYITYDIIAFCNKYSNNFKRNYSQSKIYLDQRAGPPGKCIYAGNQITYIEKIMDLFLSNFVNKNSNNIIRDYVKGKITLNLSSDKKFRHKLIDIFKMLLEMCKKSYKEYTKQPCQGQCNATLTSSHLNRDNILEQFINKI